MSCEWQGKARDARGKSTTRGHVLEADSRVNETQRLEFQQFNQGRWTNMKSTLDQIP
ncbi:hypothetical protein PsorP6_012494 [Peronosclerospora sorghi]|uniref:Uncharacterized protein n=1 Tax=Peronosclerospora sorghi TaxID=230839 RepID=A0ACC0WGL8_9STRA|nr:hypothetical protein PsorP6_012494 [Peronosclerospora sorghi]